VEALGVVIGLFVGVPSLIAGALGISCFERRMANPPIVWVAAIWNGVLLAAWLLLSVIGAFSGM
jgi:hypothetical protein